MKALYIHTNAEEKFFLTGEICTYIAYTDPAKFEGAVHVALISCFCLGLL